MSLKWALIFNTVTFHLLPGSKILQHSPSQVINSYLSGVFLCVQLANYYKLIVAKLPHHAIPLYSCCELEILLRSIFLENYANFFQS